MDRLGTSESWPAQPADTGSPGGTVADYADELRTSTVERPDLGGFAGPRARDEPGYRWIRYKEAFSPALVREILDSWSGIEGPVLDPFAGTGTSVLVANERDLAGIGVELLAYPQWAAATTIAARTASAEHLREIASRAVALASAAKLNDVAVELAAPAAKWALSDEVKHALLSLQFALPPRGSGVEADLAHLALISSVEGVSMSVKDGTSLRHRSRLRQGRSARPGRKENAPAAGDVRVAFGKAVSAIADDLPKLPSSEATGAVLRADARDLPLADHSAGCAIFSPPYPNRYDYSAVYQLELAVGGFVRTGVELRAARKALLRSHLEAPAAENPVFDDPLVVEVLRAVADAAALQPAVHAGRTMRMLVGYFDDMKQVLHELARVLRPGAPAACVVASQTYFGTSVPTDLLLASLARRAGLIVEEVWVLRRKGVAAQQRARGVVSSTGGRESALLLRRPN